MGRRVLSEHKLSLGLSFQATKVPLHNEDLSLQCERQRGNLLGYLEGSVESSSHNFQSATVDFVPAHRLQSSRSIGARNRPGLPEGPCEARPDRQGMGAKVRHMIS